MAIAETIQYTLLLGMALVFMIVGLIIESQRMMLKIISGLFWLILSLVQFILGGVDDPLTVPMSLLWMGLGIVMWSTAIMDFFKDKHERIFSFEEP